MKIQLYHKSPQQVVRSFNFNANQTFRKETIVILLKELEMVYRNQQNLKNYLKCLSLKIIKNRLIHKEN